ncbi:hypothetical protein N9X15_01390 [Flavobacteriaceae bacterium]|nr:hypothetical protein [Flavobacteriaceae bacterium]
MKKLLLLSALLIFACSSDDSSEDSPLPTYTIEGKWLIEGSVPAGNTMYLFEDGVRYTYYCVEGDCNALYNSYEANDGNHIPTTNPYTFENNVLTVDLHFGNELVTPVAFECDGGEAHFETPEYSLFRLNSDCN